jgi:hypothetical protein
MALSPNYGFPEPDNSSLVKNGAADIRTLGDAIDTSVWNVGFGQAGKNKLINGDFYINQRGFTSTTSSSTYTFDRWRTVCTDGTVTYSAQTFTPGAAPVAGYEGANFMQVVTSGQTLTSARANLIQSIENVRNFAGQTVTVSFWAKAATGTPSIAVELTQIYGAGGSSGVNGILASPAKQAITTSWARYSYVIAVPSVSGKTLGTSNTSELAVSLWLSGGSDFNARTGSIGIQSNTFQIWGVQIEYGSKATPFQTASGGSIQGELAMCQRYYQVISAYQAGGNAYSTSAAGFIRHFPVTMRIAPTATYPTTLTSAIQVFGTGNVTPTAVATANSTTQAITFNGTGTGAMVTFSLTFWSGSDIALSSEL